MIMEARNQLAKVGGRSAELPLSDGLPTCQSIDWYCEGESRKVMVQGVTVEVRMVARKGRKVRIAITAPAGAIFQATWSMRPRSANLGSPILGKPGEVS